MHCSVGFGVAAAACLAAGAASACGAGKLLFSDAFDTLQTTWGHADQWASNKNGQLQIAEMDGKFYTAWADLTFRNLDYCADVVLNDTSDKSLASAYGGIVFWMRDPGHFYTMQITLDGYANVYKYDGMWTALVDDTEFDAVKQGKGVTNSLRVVTRSGKATMYINGVMFNELREPKSPGTSHVGLIVQSPDDGTATFSYDNVVVREPSY